MPWQQRELFHEWPEGLDNLPLDKMIRLYDAGFAGCRSDPAAVAQFLIQNQWDKGEDAAHEFGLADTGKGKLAVPFVHILDMFPGSCPGPAQERGDCVSHSTKNAALLTMVCDIVSGQPDENTGKPEAPPEVSEEGIKQGVLATETFYWWRGHGGDGWSCHAAANVATRRSGLFVRRSYPELGIDLTSYSGRNAGLYGKKPPTGEIVSMGQQHLIHQATELGSFEEIRDFLFNGYGLSSCGGEGYQKKRDENGVSKRSGSWSHAFAYIGFDDRDAVRRIYNEPLVCSLNSWSIWNSGPRDIIESAALVPPASKDRWLQIGLVNPATGNIMIPDGAWWTPWSQCKNREVLAFSGVNGWPRKQLPDFGTSIWG